MNNSKKQNIIIKIIKIYILVLSVFFLFRLILFFTEIERINFSEVKFTTIFRAFIMGVRFDTVISSYILALPILVLFILDFIQKKIIFLEKIIFYWIYIFFSIAFMISAADIPYFNQFFSRFSISAFEWFDNLDFVFKMVLEEPKYFLVIIPYILLMYLFYRFLKKIYFKEQNFSFLSLKYKIPSFLLIFAFVFLGIRGRIQKKSPIRIGTAYFCNHPFLNQLGLNPTFTLLRSYLDSKSKKNKVVNLIDEKLAIKKVQEQLNMKSDNQYISPIARKITPQKINQNKPNIVMVIMESMSAGNMKRYGNTNNLTPFLDSLVYKSLYFDNIYSAGKHTYNGIFSSLFSFPALYRQHPMRKINNFYGISAVLKAKGYSTTFFINHDTQFDNIEGFLRANNFDEVIGQKDYPLNEIKNTLGVPDDFMFRFSLPILDNYAKSNRPFFVAMMTASNHGPFYIPNYFKPKSSNIKSQVIEYSDWSIKEFIKDASKKEWFDNTIFVFLADHGAALSTPYDIALNYHHSPLIYFSPKLIHPEIKEKIGGQIDAFPTLMGILDFSYVNNTLGIDLLKEERPYIFFNEDDKQGVINDSLFYIMQDKRKNRLYKYRNLDKINYSKQYIDIIKDMEDYTKSNLQVFQYMLKHPKTLTINKIN